MRLPHLVPVCICLSFLRQRGSVRSPEPNIGITVFPSRLHALLYHHGCSCTPFLCYCFFPPLTFSLEIRFKTECAFISVGVVFGFKNCSRSGLPLSSTSTPRWLGAIVFLPQAMFSYSCLLDFFHLKLPVKLRTVSNNSTIIVRRDTPHLQQLQKVEARLRWL